jgi:hypothetical protein
MNLKYPLHIEAVKSFVNIPVSSDVLSYTCWRGTIEVYSQAAKHGFKPPGGRLLTKWRLTECSPSPPAEYNSGESANILSVDVADPGAKITLGRKAVRQ